MRLSYKHTQIGRTLLGILAVCALIDIGVYAFNHTHPSILLVLLPLLIAAALFCSLSIEVDERQVKWSFGPGFIHRELPVAEVTSAEPVRTAWYHGWGIHRAGGGWLYNVSGFDAVLLTLKDGSRIRLGTDEPEALTASIRSQIG
jgi:hypothetical protein